MSLNCQKAYHRDALRDFLTITFSKTLEEQFDFLLLQEASPEVIDLVNPLLGDNYEIARMQNPEVKTWSQCCIVYHKKHKVLKTNFFSFAHLIKEKPRPEFGCAVVVFENFIITSIHRHASFHITTRRKEALLIKKDVFKVASEEELPLIVGGDWNTGIPGECYRLKRSLRPELIDCSDRIGYTCESKRVEPSVALNRFALFLARFGINVRLAPDHIFVDKKLAENRDILCKKIEVAVSDHLPLVLEM